MTRWSKIDTMWEGVSLDTLLADLSTDASFALAHSYGDYSTNLPLNDLTHKQAWIAFRYDVADLAPEHGGPARLLVPHLYFWKSAKWLAASRCWITTKQGSGSAMVTITTETHGGSQRYSAD